MRYWVFTSKPEHFKMSEALVPGETLDWPTFARFKFEVGDLVFIYASNPVLQMIGKLEIEELNLSFSEVNPRNDLRKWPKRHSSIPWMRMRVLQQAPVPFKPLQRGSLYYHTEFKPSPYPKLLHEGEIDYVMRTFNEAMTYRADMVKYPDGLNPVALDRVTHGEILRNILSELKDGHVVGLGFSNELEVEDSAGRDEPEVQRTENQLMVKVSTGGKSAAMVSFTFSGIIRANWTYEHLNNALSGVRLDVEDTYLHFHFDGAELEILAERLRID